MDQELKQTLEQMEKRLMKYIDQKFDQIKKDIIDDVRAIMSEIETNQDEEEE
jgi:hypothetical protein